MAYERHNFLINTVSDDAVNDAELVYFLYRFRKNSRLRPSWWIIPPIGFALQSAGLLLNKIDRSESFAVAHVAVARKPGARS